jgi:hypothetical protein
MDGGLLAPGDAGLALGDACGVLNRQRCAYFARCGLVGPSAEEAQRCFEAQAAQWCGPATWPAHVMAGALRYDGRLAQTCADGFATRSCGDWEGVPDACDHFLTPGAKLRQACFDGFQDCSEGACRGAVCPRTCQPLGQQGEVCRQDSDCEATLFCRPSTTTPGVGLCTAYAGQSEPCDTETRCLAGLGCVSSQCRQLPGAGQPCLSGRCEDSAYCDLTADGGACLARKGITAACRPGECEAALVCGTLSRVCEARQVTQLGLPCTGEQQCPTGTVCVGWTTTMSGLCLLPRDEGERCVRHADCLGHLGCFEADGGRACARRQPQGARCDEDRACDLEAHCVLGKCVGLGTPGQSCAAAGACLWGACVDAGTAGPRCAGLLGPGASCTGDSDCASARCEQGSCLAACTP